jgi:hypothetical protein
MTVTNRKTHHASNQSFTLKEPIFIPLLAGTVSFTSVPLANNVPLLPAPPAQFTQSDKFIGGVKSFSYVGKTENN